SQYQGEVRVRPKALLAALAILSVWLSRRFWACTNQLLVYSSVNCRFQFRNALDGRLYRLFPPRQRLNTCGCLRRSRSAAGFLPGLNVNIPRGLTCIIGARGSGKSTLAEALRFALCGIPAAPKHCADLIQANLAGGALVTITALAEGSNHYTVKRGLKQNPV